MLTPEQQKALEDLETEEEKKARLAAGIDKPRRGRHPADCDCGKCGQGAKPASKMSVETLRAGAISFVKFNYLLARGGAYVFGFALTPLEEGELEEGAKEAENLIRRFAFLVIVLSIIGFPVWLFGKIVTHAFKRKDEKKAAQATIAIVPPQPASEGTHGK